ncbi:MAG: carboxypeptidase regulatory-like domain-containing protein [Planctomycetes bacterium]|nr:carboxypeptidase regulatory-like domain-containing protein [Planctomycetota bacterium]
MQRAEHEPTSTASESPAASSTGAVSNDSEPGTSRANDATSPSPTDRYSASGVVVAADTGEPIPHLELEFKTSANGVQTASATTDEHGRFRTPRSLDAGDFSIATEDGTFGFFLDLSSDFLPLARARIVDGDVDDLQVVYPWTGSIEGRVVDADGRAIAGAEVGAVATAVRANREPIQLFDGALKSRAVVTDVDGRFSLERLPLDRPLSLAVRASGFASLFSEPVLARADSRDDDVTLRLLRQSTVAGRVEEADGSPIAGVSVHLGRYGGLSYDSPVAVDVHSGEDGTFEFTGFGPGSFRALATLRDRKFEHDLQEPFDVAVGQTLRLTFHPAGVQLSISGTVVDRRGEPVVGINVGASQDVIDSGRTVSDSLGRFSCAVHATGRYSVIAGTGPYCQSNPIEVNAGAVDVTLVFPEPIDDVVIPIVDDATGKPIRDADVWLFVGGGEMQGRGYHCSSNLDGEFLPKNLQAGTYDVFAAARGFAPARATFAIASDESASHTFEVRLSHGRRVSGRIVDAQGRPCGGIPIAVLGECGKSFDTTTVLSAPDGSFTVDSAPMHGGAIGAVDRWRRMWGMQSCAESENITIHLMPDFNK